jgi:uncharacterized protein (DUF1697 family)
VTVARYALLLRGVNVGRARRVGMADLRELLTGDGYENVGTHLRSGNVVLDAKGSAAALARAVEPAIEKRFGFPVAVIVRSRAEMRRVVARDPLGDIADDGSRYFVAFLAAPANPPLEDTLGAVDLGDERYVVDGTELYAWCPGGITNSPLFAALGKARGGPATTVRNWNTVQKLTTMLG